MTLNVHYALCFKIHAFSEHATKIWIKVDLHYTWWRCSPVTLVAWNVRLVRIFVWIPWRGIKQQWGCWKRQFSVLSLSVSSDALELKPTLLYYIVLFSDPLSPFHWPQNVWPWVTVNGHFTLFCFCQLKFKNCSFLPARRYACAGLCDSDVSVRTSVCHTPVLCLAEWKQDREMYTFW